LANSSTCRVPKNSILIGLAGQGKTRGTAAITSLELCTNQSIAAIIPNEQMFNSEYLYQNLDNRYEELRELSTGDGGRGGLNLTILRNLQVPFPSIIEQTAIATILSVMDGEIEALTEKLEKTRLVKQGMMQELLTGRKRIWKPEENVADAEIPSPERAAFISVGGMDKILRHPVGMDRSVGQRPTLTDTKIKSPERATSKRKNVLIPPLQGFNEIHPDVGRCPTLVNTALSGLGKTRKHPPQFDDAVAFAVIAKCFASGQRKLYRVRTYKLLYLLRRKQKMDLSGFKKNAAGPYKSEARYAGGEKIAIDRGYIAETKDEFGTSVTVGKTIEDALQYARTWNWQADAKWLIHHFKDHTTNPLETLATVDMAMCELRKTKRAITLETVKDVIRSSKKWMEKLEKTHFSDVCITNAINESVSLFGGR